MMGTLGEYLKTAREEKGLSLSDMAERTRISRHFLQALEDGDFSSIPGDVFVSGFLRSYAKDLGLSEKEAMARYREETGEGGAARDEAAPDKPGKDMSSPSSGPIHAKLVYYALAVIAIIIFITAFLTRNGDPPIPAPAETPPAASVDAEQQRLPGADDVPPVEEPLPDEVSQAGLEAASPVGEPSPDETGAALEKRAVNLKITALMDTWYLLTVDGSPGRQGILVEGQTVEAGADSEILLDLGNAGGVEIEFNGEPAGPFGPTGSIRRGIRFAPGSPGVIRKPEKPAAPAALEDRSP